MPPRAPKSSPSSLLAALDFISPVMEKKGTLSDTHCSLVNGYCSAFNGLVGMGHPINEDITAYPAFAPLKAALARSAAGCSIAIKDSGDLFISAPPFRATIKGVQVNQINRTIPDQPIAPLDDNFRAHLSTLEKIVKDEDSNIAKCALLVQSGTMIATDGVMLLEAWHGHNMPSILLPKEAATILAKIKAPMTAFGYTENRSITFWFDRAWFKTQLMDAKFPNLESITGLSVCPQSPPVGLIDAIAACRAHSEDHDAAVYFGDGVLQSHAVIDEGAAYDVPGLQTGGIYNSKYLAIVAGLATGVDFSVKLRDERICGFVGTNIRGFLMSRGK